MKTTASDGVQKQELKRVGQSLYRNQQSGVYYAILKRGGKQIKRSLRTSDRALANRRLGDLVDQAAGLAHGGDSAIGVEDLAKRWLRSAPSPIAQTAAHDSTALPAR